MLGRRTTLKDILIIHLHPQNRVFYHQRWCLIECVLSSVPFPLFMLVQRKKRITKIEHYPNPKTVAAKAMTEHSSHQPAIQKPEAL